jgi:mycoredoxin
MMQDLECRLFVNSALPDAGSPALAARGASGEDGEPFHTLDVAAEPVAAHQLLRLGISPRHDLPAVLLCEPGGKIRVAALRLSAAEVATLCGGGGIAAGRLVVYSSSWCPDCRRAKRVLDEAATAFEEVDLHSDPEAEARVLERSGGRRVVPTLLFDDRFWAFNPDPPLLRRLMAPAGGRPA